LRQRRRCRSNLRAGRFESVAGILQQGSHLTPQIRVWAFALKVNPNVPQAATPRRP
jgi:hypothetical protein